VVGSYQTRNGARTNATGGSVWCRCGKFPVGVLECSEYSMSLRNVAVGVDEGDFGWGRDR
jgi:hypothetical protein